MWNVPCRPGDAVAVTVAPSGFLHLDIPLCQRSYIHGNTREKNIISLHTRLDTHTHTSGFSHKYYISLLQSEKRWIKGCQRWNGVRASGWRWERKKGRWRELCESVVSAFNGREQSWGWRVDSCWVHSESRLNKEFCVLRMVERLRL